MARIWRFGSDVNTDQIVPGRYAPYMTSEDELGKYPFIEARPEFAQAVRQGDVIVAGPNFGCGSSREYAARALKVCGIVAVIAPMFARIFARNALNLGLPCFEVDLPGLEDGDAVSLDLESCVLVTATDRLSLPQPPDWMSDVWTAGGLVAYLQQHGHFPGEAVA